MAEELRTTSLRLDPESLGSVYAYRGGSRFQAAWQRIEDAKRLTEFRRLPYGSLCTALRVMSSDFVRLQVWTRERDPFFLVSRKPLTPDMVREALLAWEHAILPRQATGILAKASDDLREQRIEIATQIQRRRRQCFDAPGWVWEAATWEVAYQLAAEPIVVDDGSAALRIDTDGGLLTWDRPVFGGRKLEFQALHRIVPRLITVPGLTDPVVHLDSSLVRLTNRWSGNVRSAWAGCSDGGLLLMRTQTRRLANGTYRTVWSDLTADVLRKTWSGDFPEADEVDLCTTDAVRARPWHVKPNWPIGKGTGQMFHEAVGLHARKYLTGCTPIGFVKARRQLERSDPLAASAKALDAAAAESGRSPLRIVCMYATDETRKRMADAIAELLDVPARSIPADDEVRACGAIELAFRSPAAAKDVLTCLGQRQDIERWTAKAIAADEPRHGRFTAMLVETAGMDAANGDTTDPKHVIRRLLARKGIASQFLSDGSAPAANGHGVADDAEDHGAKSASWDLLRSAGVFVRKFPELTGVVATGTWLVGVYAVKRQDPDANGSRYRPANEGFVVTLVAAEAGTRNALGYSLKSGWVPLGQATTDFLSADDHNLKLDEARILIERAVQQLLLRDPARRAVVFMDAAGCRRFWSGLKDTGDSQLPPFVATGRVGLVRVRADADEVPRPAGTGEWPQSLKPTRPGEMNALVRLEASDWDAAQFYVSTPRVMNAMGAHRRSTRFACAPNDMRRDWHSLNMTEFSCRHAGPFDTEGLYELAALLCRQAPTWEGTLNWPSPLHLAKAIVKDHQEQFLRNGDGDGEGA